MERIWNYKYKYCWYVKKTSRRRETEDEGWRRKKNKRRGAEDEGESQKGYRSVWKDKKTKRKNK